MSKSYKDLIVYQKSYELALEIHKITPLDIRISKIE